MTGIVKLAKAMFLLSMDRLSSAGIKKALNIKPGELEQGEAIANLFDSNS